MKRLALLLPLLLLACGGIAVIDPDPGASGGGGEGSTATSGGDPIQEGGPCDPTTNTKNVCDAPTVLFCLKGVWTVNPDCGCDSDLSILCK